MTYKRRRTMVPFERARERLHARVPKAHHEHVWVFCVWSSVLQARAAAPAGAGSRTVAPAPVAVTPGRAKGVGASAPATPAKGAAPPGVHTRGRDSAAKPRQAAKSSDKRALSSTCAGFEVGWGSGVDVEGATSCSCDRTSPYIAWYACWHGCIPFYPGSGGESEGSGSPKDTPRRRRRCVSFAT